MSFPIKTNKLDVQFDYEAIDTQYDIFKVMTTEPYFKDGALVLDLPICTKNVCSLQFIKGRRFYVLMKHDSGNLMMLKSVLDASNDGDMLTIEQQKSSNVCQDILLQLLLNSLNNSDSKYLCFNNLTGHLYCFHPDLLKRSHRNENDTIMQVPCLELRVTPELRLQNSVRTFTSVLLQKEITFKKRKLMDYPQYVFSTHNTLRRKLNNEKTENAFIQRQTDTGHSGISFLNIQNTIEFGKSKMGMLTNVISLFNEKFTGLASIAFSSVDSYTALDFTNRIAREKHAAVNLVLQQTPINLIDCIGEDYSNEFCSELIELYKSHYDAPISLGKRISKKKLNLRLIHNQSYYNGENDPYITSNGDVAIQHITFEDFSENYQSAINTIVHELIIKHDLTIGQLSLVDWEAFEFDNDWIFGIQSEFDGVKKYFFMTIHPDGKFTMQEQRFDLFSMDTYKTCITIFEDNSKSSERVKGVVSNGNKQINIIRETDWYSIPQIDTIQEELQKGNTYLRNKEMRNELLSACLDIKYIPGDKCSHYFVGAIGNGMRTKIKGACNIRKIEPYNDAPIFFDTLLPLMNVDFVRNGQLTVMPFPFKYLREYAVQQKD